MLLSTKYCLCLLRSHTDVSSTTLSLPSLYYASPLCLITPHPTIRPMFHTPLLSASTHTNSPTQHSLSPRSLSYPTLSRFTLFHLISPLLVLTHFVSSHQTLSPTTSSLLKSMSDASEVCQLSGSDPAVELNRIKVLESLRVGILFLSHLCVDDLKSTLSGGTGEE